MSPYEIAGVVFGLACVWLTAKQSIWSWPFGLLNVSAFIIMFYNEKLYSAVGLHVVCFIIGVYGWVKWSRGSVSSTQSKVKLPVIRLSRRETAMWSVIIPIVTIVIGALFSKFTESASPYIDSIITTVSLVANYLLCRKVLENWILWIITDIIGIGLYAYKGLYLTAGLYVVYLIICFIAYNSWKKELQA